MHEEAPVIDTTTIPASGVDIRSLVKVIDVDTDPATAWLDWSSSDRLMAWWGVAETDIDLRIGGPFEVLFGGEPGSGIRGSEGCRYLSYVPGEMVSFTWNAPPQLALRSSNTWVVITFTGNEAGGTTIRFVHTGFLEGADWDDYMAYFHDAWDHVLELQRAHHA
jgi:uncharacterized protein YndB with AHSA1/START domain